MTPPPAADLWTYAIDPAEALAYGRMWGVVTGQDMLRLVAAVHGDAAWRPGFDAVWDCRAVTAHVVSPEEVQPLVAEEAASGPGRDVLIENGRADDAALSQMLAAFCRRRGKDMTVYRVLDEALAALGRDALPASLAAAGADGRPA